MYDPAEGPWPKPRGSIIEFHPSGGLGSGWCQPNRKSRKKGVYRLWDWCLLLNTKTITGVASDELDAKHQLVAAWTDFLRTTLEEAERIALELNSKP